MTSDEKAKKYCEMMDAKATQFAEEALEGVEEFLSQERYDEVFTSIYDTFIAGANASREVVLELIKEVK